MPVSRESDEVLQALYSLEEEETYPASEEVLLARAKVAGQALEEALAAGLVAKEASGVVFAGDGREQAGKLARRHRLAERLLHDILCINDELTETTACEWEHRLQTEVTESICTLLGHPQTCPHGKPIHPGRCCTAKRREVGPAVEALSEFRPGEGGTVAYVRTTSHAVFDQISTFGIVPGTYVHVHQAWPSFMILVGETQLGLDRETAETIFVRRGAAE